MTAARYERFAVPRPAYLGNDHWTCIETELHRLHRSLNAEDDGQVLSDLKCLVESTARVALDIAGEPANPNKPMDQVVSRAHELLSTQPGHELARGGAFTSVASSASKMARNLSKIRNEFGGGHGRARSPEIRDEMVDLALDAALTWTRWAVRRLGLFSEGRPGPLIKDLIEENTTFYSGVLQRRLEAADLPSLDPHHQRELGVAVGQRVMQGTFVVRWDGLDPCLNSDDLEVWPRSYRMGLLHGLWFDPTGDSTITADSIEDGLSVIDPVPDGASDLREQIGRVCESVDPGLPEADEERLLETLEWLRHRKTVRPVAERDSLEELINHLRR